jgi:hypothetical protein
MAEAKKKPAAKQVMDVQKPDKVAADATAKPVIVANRQILRDPMVTAEATTPVAESKPSAPLVPEPAVEAKAEIQPEEPEPATEPKVQAGEKVITPPTETAAEEPAKEEPAAEPEAEPELEKADESETPEPTEVTTDAAIEAAAEDAEAKRDAELQKLIDKKQYFLPINAMEQRRAEQFIALGIVMSIILALAWLDISLDAGLIHIDNIHALTHFFSN